MQNTIKKQDHGNAGCGPLYSVAKTVLLALCKSVQELEIAVRKL